MSLWLQRPWATQPTGPASIAVGHPLARGLVHAWLYGNARQQDIVTGKTVEWSTPGNAKLSAGSLGRAIENSSGMRQVTPISGVSGDVNWTARWLFETAGLTALQALYRNSSGTSLGLYIDGGASTKRLKFYGGASFTLPESTFGAVNNAVVDVVLVKTAASAGVDLYVNGVFDCTLGTSGHTNLAPQSMDIWGDSFNQNTLGKKYLFQVWNRRLAAEEILAAYYAPWATFSQRRVWVPASAGGGGLLDLAGSQTASLAGVFTATGDLQYVINLAGAQTASLSGALTVSGDIQITPAPTLDLAGSQTAALAGVLSAAGDLQYTLPIDLTASAAALSGSLSIAGDLEYSTAVFLDIAAQPITLAGAFSAGGDLDPYPSLNLSGAQSAALSGVIAASGNLQYTVPFDVSQTGTTALTGTLNLSGDLEYSTTPVPPPVSPGWGGGAVGGGGKGLRELTARIAKDAEDLLERKRKAPNSQASQPAALEPAPAPTRKTSSRSAGSSESADRVAAEPAAPGSQAEVLSELRSLRGAVEKLEALILADREEARKRREQDEEEAAVVKLLLN